MAVSRYETSTVRTDWTLNGVNKTFTLTYVPTAWSVVVFFNGLFQPSTVSGSTVTTTNAPELGDLLDIRYVGYTGLASEAAVLGIANLALIRLGAKRLASLSDGSVIANDILAIWDYVRDEVLQARDWKFAKTRVALTVSTTTPLYTYNYAYPLPSDFLRLCEWKGMASKIVNPAANEPARAYIFTSQLSNALDNYDPPIYPPVPFVVETLPADETFHLLTNYDNTNDDLYINYIRRVADFANFTPIFNSCFAYRLAQELAISIKESERDHDRMQQLYERSLIKSDMVNMGYDSDADMSGDNTWEMAGR